MITIRNFNADAYDEYRNNFLYQLMSNNARESNPGDALANEREAFAEYAVSVFADDIKSFVEQAHDADVYKEFVNSIFQRVLNRATDDPVWKLLEYLANESDFFLCPASTKYHGNEQYGLIRHSLMVLANGLKLTPLMLCGEVDMYYLAISCLFHDLCKVNMYEIKTRNIRNEETGSWEKAPYYRVMDSYISYGHGVESILRLNKYIALPEAWNQAVRWHMGAYDISPLDKYALDKAMLSFREVFFLHTADMLAGHIDDV